MKRYYDNSIIDPIRSTWDRSNQHLKLHTPINKLQDDIMINNISNGFEMNQPLNMLQKRNNDYMMESFSNIPNQNNMYGSSSINKKLNVPPPKMNEMSNSPSYSLKTNSYSNTDSPIIELLPKKNSIVPNSNPYMNVTNYNNDKYRINSISQELFEKDEELQKYKNEVYHLQNELNIAKKEKNKMISADLENKMLKDKLNEQFEISREITFLKHKLKRKEIENNGNNETIETLKNIIHKQHLQLASKQLNSSKKIELSDSEDEEINTSSSSDEDSYYSSDSESEIEEKKIIKKTVPPTKKKIIQKKDIKKENKNIPKINKINDKSKTIQPKKMVSKNSNIKPTNISSFKINPPKKVIYHNSGLKVALMKQGFDSKKIDHCINEMKITQKTPVTKELINIFLSKLK